MSKSSTTELNRALLREMRLSLETGYALDTEVPRALQRCLRSVLGPSVDPAQLRAAFPELPWPARFSDLRLDDKDGAEVLEGLLPLPEELSNDFWARCGMTVCPYVLDLHSGTRSHHVELHLLTDQHLDWWFTVPCTNYGGGWELGPPSPATRPRRQHELVWFLEQKDGWVSDPHQVRTSLTGADYQWLKSVAARLELRVKHRRGMLRSLSDNSEAR